MRLVTQALGAPVPWGDACASRGWQGSPGHAAGHTGPGAGPSLVACTLLYGPGAGQVPCCPLQRPPGPAPGPRHGTRRGTARGTAGLLVTPEPYAGPAARGTQGTAFGFTAPVRPLPLAQQDPAA